MAFGKPNLPVSVCVCMFVCLGFLKSVKQSRGMGRRRHQVHQVAYQTLLVTLFSPLQPIPKQIFTSHGPTVIMPTWFCSREWFCHLGRFDEGGKGTPEDLLFFYEHIRKGGGVFRVNKCLLLYRYHLQAATHSVLESTIWTHRVLFLEERILNHWTGFTIWNAGKQGRKLFRSLSSANQKKVEAFCDVDENKIAKGFYTYEESKENPKPKIPILHFKDASPPFIICMKLSQLWVCIRDISSSYKVKDVQLGTKCFFIQ
ncbi:queuosine-tRNA galactosyltransferase isoform X10 [Pogona vitticeps]